MSEGGICWKFTSPSFTSVPDRICLFWRCRIAFAEIKTTGNKPTKRQAFVHALLRKLGFPVFVIDDYESMDVFKAWVKSGRRFFDRDEFVTNPKIDAA